MIAGPAARRNPPGPVCSIARMSAAPRPPAPGPLDPLVALADRCVQCGLCLPACPTYRLDRLEAESPRGRIALARAWTLGTVPPTPAGDRHLDQCLGCRRCEAVCPAGVQFGPLLVAARAAQRRRRPPGARQRLAEAAARRPRLLAGLLRLYRLLYPLLPAPWRPLPRPPAAASIPPPLPAAGAATAALFLGCVARGYEAGLQAALHRLCAAAGVGLAVPTGQACCGSLHAHAGDIDAAAGLAGRNRSAFAGAGTVLTAATGCHEAVAAALPPGTAVDAAGFLAARAERLRFRPVTERVALHVPCTQRSVVRSDAATRALLARVPGLEVVELVAGHGCCGAAGTRMLTDPARAAAFRQPLLDEAAACGATRLLSANIGCRLHLAGATALPVVHPLEFLAECLA